MADERLEGLISDVGSIAERIDDLVFDAAKAQGAGGDGALAAREFERELTKVRRSLAKADQILRALANR
jgi:hypothetical protein